MAAGEGKASPQVRREGAAGRLQADNRRLLASGPKQVSRDRARLAHLGNAALALAESVGACWSAVELLRAAYRLQRHHTNRVASGDQCEHCTSEGTRELSSALVADGVHGLDRVAPPGKEG